MTFQLGLAGKKKQTRNKQGRGKTFQEERMAHMKAKGHLHVVTTNPRDYGCCVIQVTLPFCASVPLSDETRPNALILVQDLEEGSIPGLVYHHHHYCHHHNCQYLISVGKTGRDG